MISDEVIAKILAFRDERDWRQFHNGKDLAISLNLEASELLEIFQWSADDLVVEEKLEAMKEELADIIMYAFLFADKYNIDLNEVLLKKLEKNALKYPVSKAKGRKDKYTELKDGKE
ncbi:MAG: nucleotide pyrophosphohydrolase [Bacilli bacterium]|nr:nucleotide pyrophosphohydrolase [Bacilli bacterium]